MARTRDLVALSAILVAPLAAILVSQALPCPLVEDTTPVRALEPAPAPVAELPAPVVAPEPVLAPEPVVASEPVLAPAPVLARAGGDPAQAVLMLEDALVLHTHADIAWASGRPVIKAEPGHLLATRSVRWDSVPEPQRGLAGATMIVHAADGGTCITTVGTPRIHLEQTGDVFSTLDEDGYDSNDPPTSKAVLRDMVKKLFTETGDLLLLARQDPGERKPCVGLWARRADLPAATVFGRRPTSTALTAEALVAVRAQPEFAALAAEYAAYLEPMDADTRAAHASWDEFVATNFAAATWHEVGGPRQIVSVELELVDRMPCSDDFYGGMTLLLERRGDALVRLDQQPNWHDLAALMDLEGDGALEAVTDDGFETVLHTRDADDTPRRDSYSVPYIGCPC